MAKVVIAGRADCPYYVRTELLGDRLAKNLSDFKVHKIVKQPGDWEEWLKTTCEENGWEHSKSPMVWRELIDRGGKGVLIGGANEFQEYVKGYYDLQSSMTSQDMRQCAAENLQTKTEIDEEERALKAQSHPLHISISNASSPVCYNLIIDIAKGHVFGNNEISLQLLDVEDKIESLMGIEIEADDLSEGLLRDILVTSNPYQAFCDSDVIILLDDIEKGEEEENDSWLKRNADHFSNYAKIISESAHKNVKVLLAGSGPVNFNAFMMIKNAPNVARQNIVALSRLVENRAKAVVGEKLHVNTSDVVDLVVWGNINGSHFIDINITRVHNFDGAIWGPPFFSVSAVEMIHDAEWVEKEFVELVQGRLAKVEAALKHTPSMSHATSIALTMNQWMYGSPKGEIFSLGILSEGWYDIPEDLVFSFPVTLDPKGYWNVVQDIHLTDETKEKFKQISQELIKEREVIFPPPPAPVEEKPASEENTDIGSSTAVDVVKDEKTDEDKEKTGEEAKDKSSEEMKDKSSEEMKDKNSEESEEKKPTDSEDENKADNDLDLAGSAENLSDDLEALEEPDTEDV